MSNWNERERKILKLKLGGAEKAYDPLRLILNYNRTVRDKGGADVLKSVWDKYHTNPSEGEMSAEDRLKLELQDAEGSLYLGELGAATFGEPLFTNFLTGTAKPEGGGDDPGWTLGEGIQALYQFLSFITKKENGEESSPTSTSPESPQPGETKEDCPTTPTTSPAS